MTRVIRTCYLLLASYYILAVCANMPDMKTIKSKIEVEIEVEKIKNNIIQNLRNSGVKVNLPPIRPVNPTCKRRSSDPTASRIITDDNCIPTLRPRGGLISTPEVEGSVLPTGIPPQAEPKSKPLIVIGEPRSKSKKDKCLTFRFGKYMKARMTDRIDPIRMNLWIYLRVQKNRKKKKEVSSLDKHAIDQTVPSPENPPQQHRARRQTKKKKNKKKKNKKRKNKNKRKNRKNKKGRKVKIFVTDGNKRLVTMRMRVKITDWYMLELPISQFPSEISLNYTRTLCIKCKRCNKKIEIDIRSKRMLENPTVPFIHIEPHQTLPQSNFRNSNRRRRRQTRPRENRVPSPCCREDIHTVHFAKEFPNVLNPYSFNISLCKHLSREQTARDTNIPLLSQQNTSISNQISLHSPPSLVQCAVQSMQPLTLTYVDKLLNVKKITIEDVLPTGCVCTNNIG